MLGVFLSNISNFKNKKLIIFDLDGTLIDSASDLALAVNDMLRILNRSCFEEKIIDSWVGNGAKMLVSRALSGSVNVDENLDKELFDKALTIFLDSYKNNLCVKTHLYPNVFETLESLKKMGFTFAICTNKPYDFVEPILKILKINDMFEIVLGGDSLDKKKPDPAPLLHIMEKLNYTLADSIMVGDSKNDILSANSAGIDSIGVSYGYNYGEDISLYNPSVVVDDFKDITKFFGNGDG